MGKGDGEEAEVVRVVVGFVEERVVWCYFGCACLSLCMVSVSINVSALATIGVVAGVVR